MDAARDDATAEAARTYQVFARLEARGRSPACEALAEAAAADPGIMRFVASLPAAKRQPNLLFAAARYLLGVPAGIGSLRDLVGGARPELTETVLTRRTQTNEPARCAVLLPALAQLPGPVALIEVGASAGLTMLYDRYSRAERLAAAVRSARRAPPRIIKGDLLTDLPAVVAQAPAGVTVVVCHSSVLCYVDPGQRARFAATVRDLGVTWLTSEAPGVVPGTAGPDGDEQLTVVARDGRPLALADSHGTRLRWLG
jgi:Uncharacterized protein conserved in bacteria (DUF2332)